MIRCAAELIAHAASRTRSAKLKMLLPSELGVLITAPQLGRERLDALPRWWPAS